MSLNSGETLQPFKALNQLIFDSSGNLIGIQNDRAVGNDLRIGGGSGVDGTFATLIATTALKLNSGATFDLYNTADQTTNYERLRAQWTSNIANVFTVKGGTGSVRALRLGTANASDAPAPDLASLTVSTTVNSPFIFTAGSTTGSSSVGNDLLVQTLAAASGTQTGVRISPTIDQSGTAGYTALDINPTESATGSGAKLLQRWATGVTTRAQLDSTGFFGANAGVVAGNFGSIGFSSTLNSGGTDAAFARDAADTIAMRRSTNPQAIRFYNTYTDGSNGEYLQHAWSGNVAYIRTVAQGTGVSRSLVIGTFGATSLYFQTNTVTRWEVSSSGHLLTISDNTYDIGASGANRPRNIYAAGAISGNSVSAGAVYSSTYLELFDGITAPGSTANRARLYVDAADGDLKIIFSDGTIKTIVTDT